MTGSSMLRTAELPAYLDSAIERYLSFLAAMRAVGAAAPTSGPPRFADAADRSSIVAGHLGSRDPRPLAAVLDGELRRLHGDRRVRRAFVSRRWPTAGRAVMAAANGARRAVVGGRRAVRVLPRLVALVVPAAPRADDAAFAAGFGALLDGQPADPDFAAIGGYARLALPAATDAPRRRALAGELIGRAPRRLALIADALLAGTNFGAFASELRTAAARAFVLMGDTATATALDPSASSPSHDERIVANQDEAERRGLRADILATLFARQGAEIAWDGPFDTAGIVDFSAPQATSQTSVSVILDARGADASRVLATLSSVLAQSHRAIEIIVAARPGEFEEMIECDCDDRVRLIADVGDDAAPAAWNRAAAFARGEFVAIAQVGEFWLTHAVAAHVAIRRKHRRVRVSRSSAIVVASDARGTDADERRLRLSRCGIVTFDRDGPAPFDRDAEAPLEELVSRAIAGSGIDILIQLDQILSAARCPASPGGHREDRSGWTARHLAAMREGVAPDLPTATSPPPSAGGAPALAPQRRGPAHSPLATILRLERAHDWSGLIAATEDGQADRSTAAGLRAALARTDALRRTGRGAEALATLAAAEARHGASCKTRERAATLLMMFGDHHGALAALTEAIAALPPADDPAAYRVLATRRAETLIMLDRHADARDALFALVASGPPVHLEMAALTRALRTEADLDRFERALAPSFAHDGGRARTALHNFAVACRKFGQEERAVVAARRRLLHALDNAGYGDRPTPQRSDWSADAATALGDLLADLATIGLQPFLISGTLLGHVREGGVLGHDKDIDLGVFTDEPPAAIRAALARNGRFLPRPIINDRFVQATHANGTVIDVFLHWEEGGRVYHQGIKTRWWNSPFALEPASFLGSRVLVPAPADRYLAENYGPGWRTPEPDFETFVDTPNMAVDDERHMTWYLLTRLHDYYLAGKPLQFRRVWEALAPRLGSDAEVAARVARVLATIAGRETPAV